MTDNKFYDLGDDTLSTINTVIEKMALPFNLKIKFLGNSKQKKLIALKKASDEISYMNAIDLIIYINEDYLMKLEEKNAEILLTQELDRLEFDISKGKFKIAKFALQTNVGVLKKYGIEAVAEANELSELYTKQIKDGKDKEFDINDKEIKQKIKKKKDVEFLN